MAKIKGLEKLVLGAALIGSLIFNPLNSKAMAQQYEPCDTANPSYCTECRDESKRDFAKCGEIDYQNVNLVKEGRIFVRKKKESGNIIWGVDYDSYKGKVVYCTNIGKDTTNLEIFKANAERRGDNLIIDNKTKERITWDSVGNTISNIDPFWTKDRTIIYQKYDNKKEKYVSYKINQDDSDKKEISENEFVNIIIECHDKNSNFICPPSQ